MPSCAYIVALTGGIGSGKSTVAGLFAQRGAHIVDTDVIAHALTGPGGVAVPALRSVFGDEMIGPNGALDRPLMRARVFEDDKARGELEAILHPMIREEVDNDLNSESASEAPYVLLAVPLLFETMGYRGRARRTLAVDCPTDVQRVRVQKRSGLAMPHIDRVLASQLSRSLRLQLADDIVSNAGELTELSSQVTFLHDQYQRQANSTRQE